MLCLMIEELHRVDISSKLDGRCDANICSSGGFSLIKQSIFESNREKSENIYFIFDRNLEKIFAHAERQSCAVGSLCAHSVYICK